MKYRNQYLQENLQKPVNFHKKFIEASEFVQEFPEASDFAEEFPEVNEFVQKFVENKIYKKPVNI